MGAATASSPTPETDAFVAGAYVAACPRFGNTRGFTWVNTNAAGGASRVPALVLGTHRPAVLRPYKVRIFRTASSAERVRSGTSEKRAPPWLVLPLGPSDCLPPAFLKTGPCWQRASSSTPRPRLRVGLARRWLGWSRVDLGGAYHVGSLVLTGPAIRSWMQVSISPSNGESQARLRPLRNHHQVISCHQSGSGRNGAAGTPVQSVWHQ